MTPEQGFTPFTEPEVVAAYLQPVLQRLALTFSMACDRTESTFAERGWSHDAALAAYLIRKEVLESLRTEGLQVEEEDVEIERKALCGLLLKLPLVHLKIRKSKDGEIPAAGSQQSLSFYNWNLLVFPQPDNGEILPLHLLLLWNDNRAGQLETLLLVCVEGNDWRWRIPAFQRSSETVYDFSSAALDESSSNGTGESFTMNFDSANEDVPMKLTKEEAPSATQEIDAKAEKEDNQRDQSDQKKKAQ